MNFNELFQKMRELDQPVQESDKASKDYDGDGEVESGKDEYMGSRDKAIKKATGNDDDETKESLDQLATEVQHEMDECGMSPMSSPMGMAGMNKQQDNVSMNINMTGSGGGGTHVYHYEEPRALTNRERARLQTFPDEFIFEGTKESVRKQIGMAVPVRGAQVVFEALFKTLSGKSYPSIDSNMKKFIDSALDAEL